MPAVDVRSGWPIHVVRESVMGHETRPSAMKIIQHDAASVRAINMSGPVVRAHEDDDDEMHDENNLSGVNNDNAQRASRVWAMWTVVPTCNTLDTLRSLNTLAGRALRTTSSRVRIHV